MNFYFFFEGSGDHRDLHVLTHSFPTRRSSDLTLPSAYAIVNPHRHDESIEGQELRNLCTAGLAFMLVTAVNRELRTAGWYENFTAPALMSLMDLVALGTEIGRASCRERVCQYV